ncbi:MAG: beta-galactosidase trimerization domain-containing protein [Planctomycetota bacterium]|nr:beta-galactosidase trimerization domain-containing protein [Planctomycetota bacterium]
MIESSPRRRSFPVTGGPRPRKPGRARIVAPIVLVLSALGAAGAEMEVPGLFKLRMRVTKIAGAEPKKAVVTAYYSENPKEKLRSEDGEWSEWLIFDKALEHKTRKNYPNSYINNPKLFVVHLCFEPVKPVTEVEAEVAFGKDEKDVCKARGALYVPRLGLVVTQDKEGVWRAASMAAHNQRYWECLKGEPFPEAERPKLFPIVDRFIGGDDDETAWREGIENLARGGFSVIMLPPDKRARAVLTSLGLRRTAWAVYCPPGYSHDYDLKDPQKELDAWAAKEAKQYLDAGYEAKDMAFFALCDEPGWYLPASFRSLEKSPAALKRFQQYLPDQGLKPEDVGAATWDEAKPIGVSAADALPKKRLFYWSVRFLAWDSSRYMSEATRALERAFYPGMPICVNWNNFQGRFYVPGPLFHNKDKTSPDAAMMHEDWFEFGRMRGCTTLWTEDWFGDAMAPQWSYLCRRLACAARKGGVEFGGYVIPRTAGDLEDGILQKILCVVGHGGKAIKYFVFGPEYNFPGNCYSERAAKVLPSMARAHKMIGKAEDVLWPGRPPKSDVAILYPKSAQPWDKNGIVDATNTSPFANTVDYMGEVYCLHRVCQRLNIPVDFVEEEDLTPEGLKAYKVLYVTAPNIPAEGQKGIAEWLKAGGFLVTTDNAAVRDRYNEPCSILADATGIQQKPRAPMNVANVGQLKEVATTKNGNIRVKGVRGEATEKGGTALDLFDDGAPAIVEQAVDKGRALHFAFLPASSAWDWKGLSALRPWLVERPLKAAAVEAPVTVDLLEGAERGVEAPLLLSDAGAAVTLLNWSRKELPALTVSVRVPFKAASVQSVTHGALKFAEADGRVTFTLALKYADVVKITR